MVSLSTGIRRVGLGSLSKVMLGYCCRRSWIHERPANKAAALGHLEYGFRYWAVGGESCRL
jgi:hypothetical protein